MALGKRRHDDADAWRDCHQHCGTPGAGVRRFAQGSLQGRPVGVQMRRRRANNAPAIASIAPTKALGSGTATAVSVSIGRFEAVENDRELNTAETVVSPCGA